MKPSAYAKQEEELKSSPESVEKAQVSPGFNPDAPAFVPQIVQDDSGKAESTDSEEVDTDNEETWDEQPDYSGHVYICLFSGKEFQTSEDCLAYMSNVHNFDLDELSKRANFNFYDRIKIINYVRKMGIEGKMSEAEIKTAIGKREWDSIQYLFSTYENDQLLYSFEANCEIDEKEEEMSTNPKNMPVVGEDQPDTALIRSTSILKNLVLDD